MPHALLSPSSASRWIACTPSARMEEPFADTSGAAAQEGTLAHRLAEVLLSQQIGLKTMNYKMELLLIEGDKLYHPDMRGYVDTYVEFVMEQFNLARKTTSDAMIFLEQKLDMSHYVPGGHGTGDVVIIADGTLVFIDLK